MLDNEDWEVYLISCTSSGKKYVGQDKSGHRWQDHVQCAQSGCIRGCNSLLHKAIRKYGIDSFQHTTLEKGFSCASEIDQTENLYIDEYQTLSPLGYNKIKNHEAVRRWGGEAPEEYERIVDYLSPLKHDDESWSEADIDPEWGEINSDTPRTAMGSRKKTAQGTTMTDSKVHSCITQEMIAMGKVEPRKTRCKCRKVVDYKEADGMVKRGEALWFVASRERGVQETACRLCSGAEPSPTCDICKGSGKMTKAAVWDTYTTDIVLINHRTKSNKVSTPKTPTIESEHIERAYVEGNKEAKERIEEYGRLTNEMICSLIVGYEPEDNPRTFTGRTYDKGRCI